ncbi:deoxyguanosinetriphosphate triphosphohydrolase [Anaerocolumna xylanovorans]|uniref:dGTPase n=1 Tax=Anaerocolumna xylanovorans DSM 12503 TaxID=1121345 RepID=A0A1M7YGJ5_9FIRM|nr:deoxyguanosinetriphosphate triphosphohydrolase [Anaerocolumna xylanovorans]SHO51764.1 dGTPase [Anaerocolumna xylanovorans DSM 12503]
MEWTKLLSLDTQVEREQEPDIFIRYPISDLEKDYESIISSAAFRRLQDKTQVFPLDKSDFVRTRLTHSIEVSTIARQLGIMITRNITPYLQEVFRNNSEVTDEIPVMLSCAGLLHDIGNPPFGHFGEVVIGEWFRKEFQNKNFKYKGKPVAKVLKEQMKMDLENFEGNAQALRILSKVKNNQEGYDVNLTYGVLNTLIKYPTSSIGFNSKDEDVKKHKLGYFYAERNTMELVCGATGTKNGEEYIRHPLVYLMEAADDIAYATADLEDALKKNLFSVDQFIEYFDRKTSEIANPSYKKYTQELISDLKKRIDETGSGTESDLVAFQKWMELVRKWLMYVVSYRFSKNYDDIMNGIFKQDMFYETNHQESIKILKGAMIEFVYDNNEILKLELSAKKIISALMDDFIYAALYWDVESDAENEEYQISKADKKLISIISANYKEDYRCAKTEDEAENLYLRFLMVTDYISGMTDSYAKNIYQELNGI